MIFEIHAAKMKNGGTEVKHFFYDNMTSILKDSDGNEIYSPLALEYTKKEDWGTTPAPITSIDTPLNKSDIKMLKIQLGLSCNYSCEYCSQRFVPHADTSSPIEVQKFLKNLDLWMHEEPEKIQFWGGEPLVYIKILKPLAEGLREKWPNVKFGMVTNGSLLNPETNDWLVKMGFTIGMSHDGPGQRVRGPDPLKDDVQKANILDLFDKLGPGRMSFNAMVHRENMDRAAIQKYLEDTLGRDDFKIAEGGFIDTYDQGGAANALKDKAEQLGFKRLTLAQARQSETKKFHIFSNRITEWISSISSQRPASVLGQKCTMDRLDTIAVDLKGNVLTCQNVSAVQKAPNGKSHRIGHVSRLEDVKLNTSTHWSKRKNCPSCPMLQACKGSCMFLEDELWDKSCDNSYNDHIPYFAVAMELLTGYLPFYINADHLPEERKNIWGGPEDEAIVPKLREEETKLHNK
jgi:uncharacterized protein